MEAEQFLDNDLKGTYQVYDETGVTLITGIEHSEICRIMDEYADHKLKLLGIADVVGRSEQLLCPDCKSKARMQNGFIWCENDDCGGIYRAK